MNKFKLLLAGLLGLALLAGGVAYAAGLFGGLPIAGGSQYPNTLPLTGNELVPADTALTQGQNPATELITTSALISDAQYTTNASTTSFTATTAMIEGKQFVILDLTAAAGTGTITTPTAAAMIAAYPLILQPNGGYVLRIINRSSGGWTLAGGTGVTVTPNGTLATVTFSEYLVTAPTATTVTMQRIGGGTL